MTRAGGPGQGHTIEITKHDPVNESHEHGEGNGMEDLLERTLEAIAKKWLWTSGVGCVF